MLSSETRSDFDSSAMTGANEPNRTGGRSESIALLSVVVPCYNEARNLRSFLAALETALSPLDFAYEVLFVDDGSEDDTFAVACEFATQGRPVRALRFARNYGKEIALSAGLDFVRGSVAMMIDADLQHPPEVIPKLIERWSEGYDIVTAKRLQNSDSHWWRKTSSKLFFAAFNAMARTPIDPTAGDFRLLDRRAVIALRALPERTRFMKGLYGLAGLREAKVDYRADERRAGKSRFGVFSLWRFALDGLTSFSSLPLRFWSYVGVLIAVPTGLYAIWIVLKTLVWGVDMPGFATLATLVLFLGGVQLLSLGVLGEYVSRVFLEVKQRPLYVVSETSDPTICVEEAAAHGGIVLPPRPKSSL